MSFLVQDFRQAGRLFKRSFGISLLIVITLALGIGANAAIFSVIRGVLLAPLPYRDPGRLVAVFSQFPARGFNRFWLSPPEYLEFRNQATSFDHQAGAYVIREVNVTGRDMPVRARAAMATASLFETLRVSPELGRHYAPAEDLPHAAPVVVLGDRLWRDVFAADSDIVGKAVEIDGRRRTVVGVMPASFDLAEQQVELYLPLALDPADPGPAGRHYLDVIGRLRSGASLATAYAELSSLLARWHRSQLHRHTLDPQRHRLILRPLLDDLVGDVRSRILLLAAAVGLVLLIACLNAGNLLLARAESRRREIAVRSALGAGRRHLLQQFLAESLLFSLIGGGLGVLLAFAGVKGVSALNADSIPRAHAIDVDMVVVAFTLTLSIITGVLFGLAPILHTRYSASSSALYDGGHAAAGAIASGFRRALVIVEITAACFLAIGAGLLAKSFWKLYRVDVGFDPGHLVSLDISLADKAYPEPQRVSAFYRDIVTRLAALPGVKSAAAASGLPPKRAVDATETVFESLPPTPDGSPRHVDYWQFVTREYFRTMGIPLIAGRRFGEADAASTPPVAIVNETMAREFWPTTSPLGDRVRAPGTASPWLTIVGVVGDVKQRGLDQPAGAELYFLHEQTPTTLGATPSSMHLLLRAAGDPRDLVAAERAIVHERDPSLPITGERSMQEVVFDSVAQPRFIMLLALLFAVMALVLAGIGTYGVLSYTVERRTREFGVRFALGAPASQVLKMVLWQAMQLAGVGLALGVACALALRKLMATFLFGVTATDLSVFGVVFVLLAAISLGASYYPASRAASVDPLTALHYE